MIAGTVGEAAAAEFILIADEIAATVQVTEMIAADPRRRVALYPASMHGLTAMVYGLVSVAEAGNLPAVIDTLAEVRRLSGLRPEPAFARMPLGELTTYGFELLIQKALDNGWQEAFLSSPAYAAYAAERRAAGLE